MPDGAVTSPLPHTGSLSERIARRTSALELNSTFFFTLSLAAIEGGVVAVFAKQTWAASAPERQLNVCVALLGAMSELANILSFIWSSAGQGRRLVPFINSLQFAAIALITVIAFLPDTPTGLYLLVVFALAARSCWSGIITLRTSAWRANYPPKTRAKIIGRLSVVQVFVVAGTGSALGLLLDRNPDLFRVVLPVLCALSLLAVWSYGKIRVRREDRLLNSAANPIMKPWQGPMVVLKVLRSDRRYAQFMLCMFVLGFGNLMLPPIVVITMRDEFHYGYFRSILATSSVPAVVQLLFIPFWARFLDHAHVVRFRSIHSWVFVAGSFTFMLSALLHQVALVYAGAAVMGIGYAGGSLAWNLGHVDFSPPSETSRYMATHVTLNGVRGLLAPLVSVSCYELLQTWRLDAALWMFVAAFFVNALGAAGFVWLRIAMGAEAARVRRGA